MANPVFVALFPAGADMARRLMGEIEGAELHGLEGRVSGADLTFPAVADHLRRLFGDGHPIIAIASTGLVVRILGPLAEDKGQEPPVICIAADGSAVVPLLGGHGGANRLARLLAAKLGCRAAITTAGETRFGVALDDPPAGWKCADREPAKPVMAALLAGEAVALVDETPPGVDKSWLLEGGADFAPEPAGLSIRLTEKAVEAAPGQVLLHPATLALGVGCERHVEAAELADLVRRTLAGAGLAAGSIACLASLDVKEDETAVRALAAEMDLPLRLFAAPRLEEETPRLSAPSEEVFAAVGCHGVAEAAALAAAGEGARLIVPKAKSKRATCAVARASNIIEPAEVGRAPGHLALIGIGPGRADWRAPAATSAIAAATDVVGYGLYLDLLGGLIAGKRRHDYDLGAESERVAFALKLAAEGRRVALVCSGDAGIYAMASLVFELVESAGEEAWRRLEIDVVPGISALQAAAARAGAPLGHDFCTISLSDLLTPWEIIQKRLRAAAEGDFVVALYNPASRRRRRQLVEAKEILLAHRGPETPVILAHNLGRDGERLDFTTLAELQTEMVDMLTLVIVGSASTRQFPGAGGRPTVYTPRGYADKERGYADKERGDADKEKNAS